MMQLCVILCGLFHLSAVIQAEPVKQDTGVKSVTVGENVTLHCVYESQIAMHFSWYRQTLGSRPELLFISYKYDEPSKVLLWLEKNPRFSVLKKEGTNHLHIADVQLSDSATYYCGSSHSNMVEFGEGIILSVEAIQELKGHQSLTVSSKCTLQGANHQEILQEPECETIQPGGSVTFNCTVSTGTCGGGNVVLWFRNGSQHGVVHTHKDQCKPVSAPESPSQSCIYHLQKKSLSSSDAGTYYCAVVSCGKIIFGTGTKLLIRHEAEDQIRILVWFSIMRTGVLLVFITICLLVVVIKRCSSP